MSPKSKPEKLSMVLQFVKQTFSQILMYHTDLHRAAAHV